MREITLNGVTVRQARDGCGLRVNGESLDPAIRRAFQQTGVQSFISILLAQDRTPAKIAEELTASSSRDCRNMVVKVEGWCAHDRALSLRVIAALVEYHKRTVEYRRGSRTEDSAVAPLPTAP